MFLKGFTRIVGRDFEATVGLGVCGCVIVLYSHRSAEGIRIITSCGRSEYLNLVSALSEVKALTAMDIAAIALQLGIDVPADVEAAIPRLHAILAMVGKTCSGDCSN